jgi:phosphodiesterase/alkaline phosphatase D-like protein
MLWDALRLKQFDYSAFLSLGLIMGKLVCGPLLGLEGEALYTICFLTGKSSQKAEVCIDNETLQAQAIASTSSGTFWRAEFQCDAQKMGKTLQYKIRIDDESTTSVQGDSQWAFYVPTMDEKPRMAYVSCNGFSDYKLMQTTEIPYALWERLEQQHGEQAFSLMMMGGDQVYADSVWGDSGIKQLETWRALNLKDKLKQKPSKTTLDQLDQFYCQLYCKNWQKNPSMAKALASIPTVMMWDDHDIFDGWGSYPAELQNCEMYQAIYAAAAKHFELFQLRGFAYNKSKLSAKQTHYSFGLKFRGYTVLAMDNRSERSISEIMKPAHWNDINQYLDNIKEDHVLVMAGVPVVYRDFSFVEKTMDATPWTEELTDDLKDHWRAKEHQGERARLIMRLLGNAKNRANKRTVILSGDVHVGCLGVIKDTSGATPVTVHQLVSSGIVHPAPTAMEWAGITATTNDRPETLDENGQIQMNMLTAFGAGKYFRTRNYLTLQEGSDNKLWANWICENNEKPVYPLG